MERRRNAEKYKMKIGNSDFCPFCQMHSTSTSMVNCHDEDVRRSRSKASKLCATVFDKFPVKRSKSMCVPFRGRYVENTRNVKKCELRTF